MKGQSLPAHNALKELHDVDWLNGVIRGCIWDESLGPPESHPNIRLFGEVERYLSHRQIAHAGDTFNTYCQNILAEILEADPSQWPEMDGLFGKRTREETIAALRRQKGRDDKAREALRERLEVFWCNELEIICVLRNKVVHQAGIDHALEVAKAMADYPPGNHPLPPPELEPGVPVQWADDGTLLLDAKAAHWATRYVGYHVHLMDQNICHRFGVPREQRPRPSLRFQFRSGGPYRALFPGMPLPKPAPIPKPRTKLRLPVLPPIPPMADAKEIACAQKWYALRDELDAIVHAVCDESGVEMDGVFGQLAGNPSPTTIACHDMHLGYDLRPAGAPAERQNRLGIRIRQRGFLPFVTVWSDKTMMRDFDEVDNLSKIREEITTAVHATHS